MQASSEPKILLIDDDETLCKVIGEELEQENYSVTCSFSGKEGLAKLKLDKYNLVILDYQMPEMDGYEVLQEIRIIYPSLPVIIITANTDIDTINKFSIKSICDLVNKPFEFEDLLARIQKCILNT
ncbi:MAG: response regulator transcription factor [Ignavibacteriales bacterium]|nr:response regulator transcription factor [Ignavibacteriales bacterium]